MTVAAFPRRPQRLQWPSVNQDKSPIHKSQDNVRHFLNETGCEVYFDEFASRLMLSQKGKAEPLDDNGVLELYFAADAMGLRPPKAWFIDCISHIGILDKRNEIRAQIDALKWDGTPRLDDWLVRYGHGRDTEYDRAAFVCAWVAMVRRVRKPGVKFDQIIVLEGPQGCGKSSLLRIFSRSDVLFTDALPIGASDRDTLEIAHGKLIVELGELAGIGKRDLAAVKAFASRQADRARLAYGRFAVEVPRQFTIWGTTNDSEYLADPTGNRRFWPLKVGAIDLAQARADIDQLWAEAAALEARGYPITLPQELWTDAAKEQSGRLISDTWDDAIEDQLRPFRNMSVKVRTLDVLKALFVPIERQDRGAQMRVATTLKKLGFEQIAIGSRRDRGWLRKGPSDVITLVCDLPGTNLKREGHSEEDEA